ncbi:hypothetical protein [Amycolatopsis japonica]|uniref:hypothetical protein n=1 Tax=Amycolatopsis japonica TaxID=208439 RepID=UPI0037FFB1A4
MVVTRRAVIFALTFLVAVAAAAVTIVLATSGSKEADTFTLKGTLYVAKCMSSGYGDLLPGAQVEVTDQSGEVLGVGAVELSDAVANRKSGETSALKAICTSKFSVVNIPTGRKMYGVHIGNANRGVIWKPESEAKQGFELSIGS